MLFFLKLINLFLVISYVFINFNFGCFITIIIIFNYLNFRKAKRTYLFHFIILFLFVIFQAIIIKVKFLNFYFKINLFFLQIIFIFFLLIRFCIIKANFHILFNILFFKALIITKF
jgi:hypothetical protein